VTTTVNTTLAEPDAVDTLAATGDVVCVTGQVSTPIAVLVGRPSGMHTEIIIVKHFVCANGAVDVLLRGVLDLAAPATTGTSRSRAARAPTRT
jgi:hypothetical protein